MAQKKVYYSDKAALLISINKGHVENIDGSLTRVGEKLVQFVEMGNGFRRVNPSTGRQEVKYFGQYVTEDPEEIAYLDKRCAIPDSDVFGPEEFYKRSTPQDIQLAEKEREITRLNSLVETLRAQGKLPKQA